MERRVIKGKYPQYTLSFYDKKQDCITSNIWKLLESGLWKEYNIDNRLYNNALGETKQCSWKPVLPNIYPIYPGFVWNNEKKCLDELLYKPKFVDTDWSKFLDAATEYFAQYKDKKIGVHLSGGLDSSIIICLLHYLNIPFTPIGLVCNRFEFRTERTIQDKLAEYGDNAKLIDMEKYPFYSNLANTPKHQVPDSFIKMNDADGALAQAFADKGVDVVFTGQGGDTLLATEINSDFAGYNIQNEFTFPWEQDLLYGPKGIKLVSVFSDTKIIDHIFSLRINQKDDPLKLWARQFFKPILPKELSDYTYRGDFFGLSISGLNDAIPSIKELFAEAYELTHHSIFLEKELDNCDVFSLQYKTYTQLCTKISIAVWLHSLFRNDE